ncbi:thiamine phosphate synthase [Allosphingosinicella sp.]|uniref:thiamine phosphate synthase n=1 Tax=Allosphingosinicella sp. TaxID=2823234 RepID=UPI002FC0CDB6
MHRRQPLPHLWMMTDERQGETLWRALYRLPRGAGVVFRHHSLPPRDRRALFQRVRSITRSRGLLLLLAGPPGRARLWGADGSHGLSGPGKSGVGLRSAPAHDLPEIRKAERSGADLIILSPVFPTRSHPGARSLGPVRFGLLARQTRLPVIALGGMDAKRARSLAGLGMHGWAAIDAWSY